MVTRLIETEQLLAFTEPGITRPASGNGCSKRVPPDTDDLITEQLVTTLDAPYLKKPLEEFLQAVAFVPGLDAMALVVWREPNISTFLSFYYFTDLRDFRDNNSVSRSARAAAGQAYARVQEVLTRSNAHFSTELCPFNTYGEDISRSVVRFPKTLRSLRAASNEQAVLCVIAATQRPA